MTIKELENELNIPRATVRFYEKENLITPERGSNGYRDYSDDDIAKLKKIITLRKLGITVNDIKAVFDGEKDLENVVSANIKEIENQMKELTGALNLSKVICEKKENIESFDENFYWNYVADEEEKGNKFIEILDGIAKYEKHLVLNYFGLEDLEGGLNTNRLKAAFKIMAYIIGGGICYMIFYLLDNGEVSFSKFKDGAIVPVVWIIMASIVGLPLYFLEMKYPKVAAGIKKFADDNGYYYTSQRTNEANWQAHIKSTGPEIVEDTDGDVDYAVMLAGTAGTAGTLTGVGKYLQDHINGVKIVGVQPNLESLYKPGEDRDTIDGVVHFDNDGKVTHPFIVGTNFHYDEVIDVDGKEAYETARELATSDGIFLGPSAVAAVLAAKQLAQREENAGKKIVVILPDDGMKYLSTKMYK